MAGTSSATEYDLRWGRSELGRCDLCTDPERLAGYEHRVDRQLIARLCTPCATGGTLDELAERVLELDARQRLPERGRQRGRPRR